MTRSDLTLAVSILFVLGIAGGAYFGDSLRLWVYLLSFWHYYLYWLAYTFGAVPLGLFKRDAVLVKTVSLLALAIAYFGAPLDLLSLGVVAAGFLLNAAAARALGSDRTYYGYELIDLPAQRVTAFPYSWIAHPMLVGNIAAFGGTLLNAEFRQHWWPLATLHMAFNVGLLVMELAITPQRRFRRGEPATGRSPVPAGFGYLAAGAAMGALAGYWAGWTPALGALLGGCIFTYTYVLYCCYSRPPVPPGERSAVQTEISS